MYVYRKRYVYQQLVEYDDIYGTSVCWYMAYQISISSLSMLLLFIYRDYFTIDELSNRSGNVQYRFIKPAQLAITQSGLSYVTNQHDGTVIVFDSQSLSLKATHSLNSYGSAAGGLTPWMTTPTCISPDSVGPTCYIIPRNKPTDNKKLCIVTPQENGKFISVSSADLGSCSPYTVCGGPVGHIYLGNTKEECIYTYDLSRGFINTFNVNCTPSALAYDKVKKRIHVCDSYTNTIKVFSTDGKLSHEYGRKDLVMPQQLIINNDSYSFVVCCFNLRSYLAVFDASGSFMYSVHGFTAPSGVAISPNGSVWVSDSKKHCIVGFGNLSQIKLPFPLSFSCYKTILLHSSDINTANIPQRSV